VVMALKNPAIYVLKPQREGGGKGTFVNTDSFTLYIAQRSHSQRCSLAAFYEYDLRHVRTQYDKQLPKFAR